MLGISTCWWANKGCSGDTIVREAVELGFQGMELEYRVTESLYREMKPNLKERLQVLSVHNVFPRPKHDQKEKTVLLTSTDKEIREVAVGQAARTIDYAQRLGARAVVLHLGEVDMPCHTEEWIQLKRSSDSQQRVRS
jgi:sugar phosphate isomerase/epimerase